MGLNIVVGVLAGAGHEAVIRGLLDRAGAGTWAEPELDERDVLEGDMWGYGNLHTVRRVAVHLAGTGSLPDPLEETCRATDDPLLKKAYAGFPGEPAGPFDHLIHHSDCEGYYVPVDFGQVIPAASAGISSSSAGPGPCSRPDARCIVLCLRAAPDPEPLGSASAAAPNPAIVALRNGLSRAGRDAVVITVRDMRAPSAVGGALQNF